MSENIYSQFIEHLGRCIYGGIWAEMLEDRKFYFPITEKYEPYRALRDSRFPVVGASPWQVLAGPDLVHMSTNRPFVGKHTPRIQAPGGVQQLDLGITEGKRYVGYAWLKSDGAPAGAQVSLVWGDNQTRARCARSRISATNTAALNSNSRPALTTDKAALAILAADGALFVGTISLMPADNIEGMRADTLALLRELNAPIYRWPGGNFVSGYDWRDGIGDRDRRPPRTNPAWTGVEHNDFGTHEFIRFCELVHAQPWITVNTGLVMPIRPRPNWNTATAPGHVLGREARGQWCSKPFAVRYWGIGNEMWGAWQLGYMKLEHYELKQNWIVDKMREVDPSIICIASGNMGPWSKGLLQHCSDHMDMIAEHFYCQSKTNLAEHVRQIPDNIRRKAEFHRQMRRELPELKDKDIRIAMTEWNFWYGPHVFGELGTRYYLKDALGIAAGLNEYARDSDIVSAAFYAQTVNVIGCIKTTKRAAAFETTGLVLKLYRQHFGSLPVSLKPPGLSTPRRPGPPITRPSPSQS